MTLSKADLSSAEDLLTSLEERLEPPFKQHTVLAPLDDLLLALMNLESEGFLLSAVHPETAARENAEATVRQAQRLRTRLLQSRSIYHALAALDETGLDSLARRAAGLTRQDMRRAGVELSDEQRDRVRHLRDELVELEQTFARNIRDDVRYIQLSGPEELSGLPSDFVASHSSERSGQLRVGTTYPDYYPFMNYASSERARRALLHEFYNRAVPANLEVLTNILARRAELAWLLGYANWADYVTEDRMVGSARNVVAFLDNVEAAARDSVRAELAALLELKRRDHPAAQTIEFWEPLFYQQRVRLERFAFDARAARRTSSTTECSSTTRSLA